MLGGISIWQLLIIFAIIILIFGTKKLRGIGGDLGGAVKGFKDAMSDDKSKEEAQKTLAQDKAEDADFAENQTTQQKDQDKA